MNTEILIDIILTGVFSSACTIAVLKTDIKWIIGTLKRHDNRLTTLEKGKLS